MDAVQHFPDFQSKFLTVQKTIQIQETVPDFLHPLTEIGTKGRQIGSGGNSLVLLQSAQVPVHGLIKERQICQRCDSGLRGEIRCCGRYGFPCQIRICGKIFAHQRPPRFRKKSAVLLNQIQIPYVSGCVRKITDPCKKLPCFRQLS